MNTDLSQVIAALEEAIAALEAAIENIECCPEAAKPVEPVDVTDEIDVEIGTDETGIRAYFTHNDKVIVRAGVGKGAELTSYAQSNGYTLKEGRMGLRGAFFRVFKTQ